MSIETEGSGEGRSLDPSCIAALDRLVVADRQIAMMRSNLERRPKELEMKRREVATQAAALKTAHDTVKVAQKKIDQKTLESDAIATDVKKLEGQLFSLKSNDDFNAMKTQIAHRKEKDDLLQTEILELMEAIEGLKADEEREKQKLATVEASLAKAEEKARAEMAAAEAEVEAQEKAREALLAELPHDVRTLYDVAFERRGNGVARLVDQVCKGCDTQVTMNVMGAVMGARLVVCPHCQRLIILGS